MASATNTRRSQKYVYEAYDRDGKRVKGTIAAGSETEARSILATNNLTPSELKASVSGGLGNISLPSQFNFGRPVKKEKVTAVMRQLATCIQVGMPVQDSLDVNKNSTDDVRLQQVMHAVSKSVNTGKNLGVAMGEHPEAFPKMASKMVEAGSENQFLGESINLVADAMERDDKFQRQMSAAMFSPLLTFIATILTSILLSVMIVPTFKLLYESLGNAELPLPTRILVGVTESFRWSIPLVLVLIIAGVWIWGSNKERPGVREFVDRARLMMPGFGGLHQEMCLERFTRNLGLLRTAGTETVTAINTTAETIGNVLYERALKKAAQDVHLRGMTLSEVLRGNPLFPDIDINMMSIGDETGRTAEILGKLTVVHAEKIEVQLERVKQVTTLLTILLVGSMIAFVMFAAYLPYLNIGDLILNS